MFFKRAAKEVPTFAKKLSAAQAQGFTSESVAGGYLITRKGCAAIVKETAEGKAEIVEHGILSGKQVARLMHGGYQMFFLTPDGHKHPALAEHLKAVHAFREDLIEALGETSLYNQALGSTCAGHIYDRVKDRDHGVAKRPWESA
jgi:hypothetical protein